MAGEVNPPTAPIAVVDGTTGETAEASVSVPTADPQDLALAISDHKDAVGAIVVVLGTDGSLRIGMGMINDDTVKKTLLPIAQALKDHVEKEWSTKPQNGDGFFARDDDKN